MRISIKIVAGCRPGRAAEGWISPVYQAVVDDRYLRILAIASRIGEVPAGLHSVCRPVNVTRPETDETNGHAITAWLSVLYRRIGSEAEFCQTRIAICLLYWICVKDCCSNCGRYDCMVWILCVSVAVCSFIVYYTILACGNKCRQKCARFPGCST